MAEVRICDLEKQAIFTVAFKAKQKQFGEHQKTSTLLAHPVGGSVTGKLCSAAKAKLAEQRELQMRAVRQVQLALERQAKPAE